MGAKVQYSPDGKAWFDGDQWISMDCKQLFDGKRWRKTPRAAVQWYGVLLQKMKLVEGEAQCEQLICEHVAEVVVSESDPRRPAFSARCRECAELVWFDVVWPKEQK